MRGDLPALQHDSLSKRKWLWDKGQMGRASVGTSHRVLSKRPTECQCRKLHKDRQPLPIRVFQAAGAAEGWLCGKAAATGWQQSATAHTQALGAAPEPPHAEHGQSVRVGPCGGLPLGSDPQPLFRTPTLGYPENIKPTSQ